MAAKRKSKSGTYRESERRQSHPQNTTRQNNHHNLGNSDTTIKTKTLLCRILNFFSFLFPPIPTPPVLVFSPSLLLFLLLLLLLFLLFLPPLLLLLLLLSFTSSLLLFFSSSLPPCLSHYPERLSVTLKGSKSRQLYLPNNATLFTN